MKRRAVVFIVLGLGLLARVAIALITGDAFQFPDEAVYVDTAHRLSAGEGFGIGYTRVPVYPLFLAALSELSQSSVLWLRVLQAVIVAYGAVLLYGFTFLVVGHGPALAAAFLYAVDPMLIAAAGLLYPEAVAALMMIGVAHAILRASRENRVSHTALAGLLLGLLVQLRPVALILFPVIAVWVSISRSSRGSQGLRHATTLILVCLLSLLPWTYRNYRVHQQLMPVATAGTRSALESDSDATGRGLTASILHRALAEPRYLAAQVGREFLHFWELYPTRLATDNPGLRTSMRAKEPRLSAAPLFTKGLRDAVSAISFACEILLALLGMVLTWKRYRRETVLLLSLILAFALGYTMFVAKLRYRIPVLPLLFVFSGVGAHAIWQAAATRRRGRVPNAISA